MPRTLILAAVVLTTALTGPLSTAAAAAPAPVAAPVSQEPVAPEVDELDLAGVDPQAVADLPAEAPAPDDPALPAPAVAPEPEPEQAPSPAPTAEPAAPSATASATTDPLATVAPRATVEPLATADAVAPEAQEPTTQRQAPAEEPVGVTPETFAGAVAPSDEVDPDVLTQELDVAPFTVLGVSWDASADLEDVVVRYRVRQDGTWSGWEAVAASDEQPDAGGQDAIGTRGATDPIVAVDADGVQLWAQAARGEVRGLKAVLIDPGEDTGTATASNAAYTTGTADVTTTSLAAAAARPAIITRAQWGAVESQVTCNPDYSKDVRAAVVHHTASSNSYSAADVPGILRGILSYHTRPEGGGGRGWCDIGYNFLVDKFGRVFEGRTGGMDRPVVGVHAGGFNSRTFGVSAIGEYGSAGAPAAMNEAISQLIAWKFQVHRITAGATVGLVSGGGATKFPAGTTVALPTIFGHRDTSQTSCPGQNLYNALGSIRARVAQLANSTVSASPRGAWDSVRATTSGVTVSGWALDPGRVSPIDVRVTVGSTTRTVLADGNRPDIGAANPTEGPRHGFSTTLAVDGGRHAVCVWAVNVNAGADVNLGCLWVTVTNQAPIGTIDTARSTTGGLYVRGWALDRDSADPVRVHVYVDGAPVRSLAASRLRADVGRLYGTDGRHGYAATLAVADGTHRVCVYAINVPSGTNPSIGCRTVRVGNAPVGHLDSATVDARTVRVTGWALDPDTTASVRVHVYVDGRAVRSVSANRSRTDIGRLYGLGDSHGFSTTVQASPGRHSVCVYAIDASGGSTNTQVGCRTVEVTDLAPVGVLDTAVGGTGSISVRGWALDPDTTASVNVHVYVDGRPVRSVVAAGTRTDIARAYGLGAAHGFSTRVPAPAGTRTVCVYAINIPSGPSPSVGCSVVRVG